MLNTGMQNKVSLVPPGTGMVVKFGECCAVDELGIVCGGVSLTNIPAQNSAAIVIP